MTMVSVRLVLNYSGLCQRKMCVNNKQSCYINVEQTGFKPVTSRLWVWRPTIMPLCHIELLDKSGDWSSLRSKVKASGWLQSAVTTSACCVLSVIFLPIGHCPMCGQSYFCLLDVLHCNACHIFHRQVWYRVLSLRFACIRHSSIIPTPRLPLCQISFLSHSPLLG